MVGSGSVEFEIALEKFYNSVPTVQIRFLSVLTKLVDVLRNGRHRGAHDRALADTQIVFFFGVENHLSADL